MVKKDVDGWREWAEINTNAEPAAQILIAISYQLDELIAILRRVGVQNG